MAGVSSSTHEKNRGHLEPVAAQNLVFVIFAAWVPKRNIFSRTFFLPFARTFLSHHLSLCLSPRRAADIGQELTGVAERCAESCGDARYAALFLSLRAVTCACLFFLGSCVSVPSRAFQNLSGDSALTIHPRGTPHRRLSPPMGCLWRCACSFFIFSASL